MLNLQRGGPGDARGGEATRGQGVSTGARTTWSAWSWADLGTWVSAAVVVHLDRGKAREVEGGEVEPVGMGGRAEDEGGEGEHGMAGMPLAWPWLGHVLPFPRVPVVV